MWVFLWFVLSVILIGSSVWSFMILQRQKSAWEKFAKEKNFTFQRGTTMGPAEMSGVIGNYKVSFFTAERQGVDVRTKRYVTSIEFVLAEGVIDSVAMGTPEMLAFMQSLNLLHPYKINLAEWDAAHTVFVKNDNVALEYLTAERLDAFSQILKTRNADVIIIFNTEELVVRLETSDPMQDADKIDKISKRIIGLCEKVRLSPEERKRIAVLAND